MGDRGPTPLVKGRWPKARGIGTSEYGHEVSILSRPRRRFGYFAAEGKVTRRPQTAESPCEKNPTARAAKLPQKTIQVVLL